MTLYLVETRQTQTTTQILEFHRHNDGKAETKVINTYKQYFYVDEECPLDKWEGVVKVEKGFTSIEQTPLKRVFIQKSNLVHQMKDQIKQLGYRAWEADVLFQNRYTVDYPEELKECPLKVCWFDIETGSLDPESTTFPNIETADQAICCLTSLIDDSMVTWYYGKDIIEGVRCFTKEEDMLNDFLTYFHKESPDIISAWNLDGFDLPYFIHRCERLGIDYKRLSKVREVYGKKWKDKIEYKSIGTIQFDLLDGYRLWRKYGNMPLLESYSLDFVSRTVLGDQKKKLTKPISWLWHNDPKTLIEYNQHDVSLLARIDKQCKVVAFFDEIRRKCRIQLNDVYKTTAMIDGYLMYRLKKSIILPTATHYTDEEKFDGADVLDPVPGIYENVMVMDIAGMYPSIIKTFNISYETLDMNGEIKLPIGISFNKKPGIIPMFLDELKAERKVYKKLLHDAKLDGDKIKQVLYHQRQYGTKVLMNSFFGYLGYQGSRLYRREVAESITGMGVYIIREIKKWIEGGRGNKVIYGDTDSVYVLSTKGNKYDVLLEGHDLQQFINEKLTELSKQICGGENHIFIEFEKVMKRVVFTDAKKRYAYTILWDGDKLFNVDDKIHIQGFDSKRSDSNTVSKIVQKGVIEMLILNKTKDEVFEYVRGLDKKMRKGEFSDEEIGFPKGITQELELYNPPSAVVKGAAFSNHLFGTKYGKGSKPKFVYVKSYKGTVPKIPLTLVTKDRRKIVKEYAMESIAYDTKIPEGFVIDWTKMSDNTFKNKLEKLFLAVGWEWVPMNTVGLDTFERKTK